MPAEPREQVPLPYQNVPQPPIKLRGMQAVDLFASPKKSSQTPKQDRTYREDHSLMPFLSGSQVPRRVKDSPFLITDLLATKKSLPLRPVESPVKDNRVRAQNTQEYRLKVVAKQQEVISAPDGCKCSSSAC